MSQDNDKSYEYHQGYIILFRSFLQFNAYSDHSSKVNESFHQSSYHLIMKYLCSKLQRRLVSDILSLQIPMPVTKHPHT